MSEETFVSFIVETYRWLPANPDIEQIKDHVYQNEKLNEMNRAHTEEQNRAQDYNMKKKNKGQNAQLPTYYPQQQVTEPNVTFEIIEDGENDTVSATNLLEEAEKNIK